MLPSQFSQHATPGIDLVTGNLRLGLAAAASGPLIFAPGEAYQFDWSHEIVLINSTTVTMKVAHVRLCHSRMLFVRAYPRESQEMVFDVSVVEAAEESVSRSPLAFMFRDMLIG